MMKNKIDMELGESRHIRLKIHSVNHDDFTITSASYDLTPAGSREPEDKGNAVILGHVIDTVITPQASGIYHLRVTYRIADETLIDIVEVRVAK